MSGEWIAKGWTGFFAGPGPLTPDIEKAKGYRSKRAAKEGTRRFGRFDIVNRTVFAQIWSAQVEECQAHQTHIDKWVNAIRDAVRDFPSDPVNPLLSEVSLDGGDDK